MDTPKFEPIKTDDTTWDAPENEYLKLSIHSFTKEKHKPSQTSRRFS